MKGSKGYVSFHDDPDEMNEFAMNESIRSSRHYSADPLQSIVSSNPIIQIVYHTTVPIKQTEYFEKQWLPKMANLYDNLIGFRYRSVNLLVQTAEVREYLVIIACTDYHSFLVWEATPLRSQMLKELKSHGIVTRRLDTTSADQASGGGAGPSKAFLKDTLGAVPPPLPPPKWKLCIIIYIGVVANIYLWAYTGIPAVMAMAGMPLGFNLFVALGISVPILSFAFFPLVMSIPIVSRWLRAPRPPHMSSFHKLLDHGLLMFAAKMTPGPSKEVVIHFKKLECRLEATRRIQHHLTNEIDTLKEQLRLTGVRTVSTEGGEGGGGHLSAVEVNDTVRNKITEGILSRGNSSMKKSKSAPNFVDLESGGGGGDGGGDSAQTEKIHENEHGPLTVAVAHWVRWEYILDFELWTEEMAAEMAKSVVLLIPLLSLADTTQVRRLPWLDNHHPEGEVPSRPFLSLTLSTPPPPLFQSEFEPYINCFTYDSPAHMMAYIDSEARKILLK
jgi:antibiotic biosynthesis monooxygenase (ABM) superfamily enzyme